MSDTTIELTESTPLSAEDKERLRASAKRIFEHLEETSQAQQTENPTAVPSWIHGGNHDDANTTALRHRSSSCHYFDMYGFCVRPNFCAPDEVQKLKAEMARLVEEHWHPGTDVTDSFGTDVKGNMSRGDYFLESADKVSYFAEPSALEEGETGILKPEFQDNKMAALNKAGHGMHTVSGSAFSNYTLSDKMKDLVRELGWSNPVIPQSMYIFKQPSIGGTVHSHQDSTFLYTTPKQSCLGLWLALDDATLDNGCLWVRPQSHLEPVRRQFLRNPHYRFDANEDEKDDAATEDAPSVPKLIFEDRNPTPDHVTWEGQLPPFVQVLDDEVDNSKKIFSSFVPVEVKAGDLVVFCGTLDHFSLPNFSQLPRHTFQLHLVEGSDAGVEWSPKNWLQYPEGKSFVRLA
jgi:phytanoyl-CoA hydroxylase